MFVLRVIQIIRDTHEGRGYSVTKCHIWGQTASCHVIQIIRDTLGRRSGVRDFVIECHIAAQEVKQCHVTLFQKSLMNFSF